MAFRAPQRCAVPKPVPDRLSDRDPLQPAGAIEASCHAPRSCQRLQIKATAGRLRPPILHNHQRGLTGAHRVRPFVHNLEPRWHSPIGKFLRDGVPVILKPAARHKASTFCDIQNPCTLHHHTNQTPITADQYIRARRHNPANQSGTGGNNSKISQSTLPQNSKQHRCRQ